MEVRLLDIESAPRVDASSRVSRLRRRCPHVAVDGRLTALGYRFYAMPGSDVPSFFCKRFRAGTGGAALTLLAGIDPQTGEAVLDDCRSASEAATEIASGRAGTWLLRVTYGARMVALDELCGTFAHREPAAFAAIAAELEALGPALRSACSLCVGDDT